MDSTKQQIDSPGGKHFLRVNTVSLTHTHATVALKWEQEKTWTAEKYHQIAAFRHSFITYSCLKSNEASKTWKSVLKAGAQFSKKNAHLVSIHSVLELIQTSWGIRRRRLACSTRHLKSLGRGSWPHRRPDKICHHSKGIKRIQKGSKWFKMINRIQTHLCCETACILHVERKANKSNSSQLKTHQIRDLLFRSAKTQDWQKDKASIGWLSSSLNSPYHSGSHGVHLEPSWGMLLYDATPFMMTSFVLTFHTRLLWGIMTYYEGALNDSRQFRLVLHLVKEPVVDMPSEPQAGDSLRQLTCLGWAWEGNFHETSGLLTLRTPHAVDMRGSFHITLVVPICSNIFHILRQCTIWHIFLSHVKPCEAITLRHWLQVSNNKDPGSCFFASLSACSWAPAPRISRTPGWIGWSVQAERKHTNNCPTCARLYL